MSDHAIVYRAVMHHALSLPKLYIVDRQGCSPPINQRQKLKRMLCLQCPGSHFLNKYM